MTAIPSQNARHMLSVGFQRACLLRRGLIAVLACGCGRSPQPVTGEGDANPPPIPNEAALRGELTAPQLAIEIHPDVRTWNDRSDRWPFAATVTITNEEATAIVVDPVRLRLRDQSRPLYWGEQDKPSGATNLEPGGSVTVRMIGGRAASEPEERPTVLHVGYGTIFGVANLVSAPVVVARTDGLVARFSAPRPPKRGNTEHIPRHGSLPVWKVRLAVTFDNPTGELVRMLSGDVSARRQDGDRSGADASLSIYEAWIEPGASLRTEVSLVFKDSPTPPERISIAFRSATPQTLELPMITRIAREDGAAQTHSARTIRSTSSAAARDAESRSTSAAPGR